MTLHCNIFILTKSVAKDRRNATPLINKKIMGMFSKNRPFLNEMLQTEFFFILSFFLISKCYQGFKGCAHSSVRR